MNKNTIKIGDIAFSRPLINQAEFLEKRTRIVGFGGMRGGGKYYAVRLKASLMCIKYPGISICIISSYEEDMENGFADLLARDFGEFAKYDNRRKIIECKNGSRIFLRVCRKGKTHCMDGCEFDVIFTINAERYSTVDLIEFSWKVRGSERYPKRIYYIFDSFNEHLERIFLKKEYKKSENPDDYSYVSSFIDIEKVPEIPVNALELYGA